MAEAFIVAVLLTWFLVPLYVLIIHTHKRRDN